MEDLIKRSDAIKIMACEMYAEAQSQGYEVDSIEDFMPEAKSWMNDAPSADRPQGEWIRTENYTIKCCECGAEFTDDIMDACLTSRVPFPRACPICMARMKGADDE